MTTARRTNTFTESVIREMTRIANEHGALNLAQGMPDFPMPQPLKDAACTAIQADINQYAITWGTPSLRLAIAGKYRRWYGMDVDPERNVTVTCGATEAMVSVFLALVNPGDEVIVFEPYYENYGPDAILSDATPCRSSSLAGESMKRSCVRHSRAKRKRSSSTRPTIPPDACSRAMRSRSSRNFA